MTPVKKILKTYECFIVWRNYECQQLISQASAIGSWELVQDPFVKPDIDLLALHIYKNLDKYVSWYSKAEPLAVDEFSTCDSSYFYMFSILSIIGQTLAKITWERTKAEAMVLDCLT